MSLVQVSDAETLCFPFLGFVLIVFTHVFFSCVDQTFPETSSVPVRGAVVLCYDLFSVCRAGTALTNSSVRDSLVFSENQQMLSLLPTTGGRQITPAVR